MKLMEGKKGIIFGVSNTHGIAYAIAKQLYEAGAEIAFTYAGEPMEKRVRPLAEEMGAKIIMSCDVTKEDEVKAVFAEYEKVYGKLDFLVHAVAFANREDLFIIFAFSPEFNLKKKAMCTTMRSWKSICDWRNHS